MSAMSWELIHGSTLPLSRCNCEELLRPPRHPEREIAVKQKKEEESASSQLSLGLILLSHPSRCCTSVGDIGASNCSDLNRLLNAGDLTRVSYLKSDFQIFLSVLLTARLVHQGCNYRLLSLHQDLADTKNALCSTPDPLLLQDMFALAALDASLTPHANRALLFSKVIGTSSHETKRKKEPSMIHQTGPRNIPTQSFSLRR